MSRIRTVKPEWLDSEDLIECSDSARLLSVSLILLSDDWGLQRAALKVIGSRTWPAEGTAAWAKAEACLAELESAGFVEFYDDRRYLRVAGWFHHQKVDNPGRPRCPMPEWAIEQMPPRWRHRWDRIVDSEKYDIVILAKARESSQSLASPRESSPKLANPREEPTQVVENRTPRESSRILANPREDSRLTIGPSDLRTIGPSYRGGGGGGWARGDPLRTQADAVRCARQMCDFRPEHSFPESSKAHLAEIFEAHGEIPWSVVEEAHAHWADQKLPVTPNRLFSRVKILLRGPRDPPPSVRQPTTSRDTELMRACRNLGLESVFEKFHAASEFRWAFQHPPDLVASVLQKHLKRVQEDPSRLLELRDLVEEMSYERADAAARQQG